MKLKLHFATRLSLCTFGLGGCVSDDSSLPDEAADRTPTVQVRPLHPEAYDFPLRPGDPEWAQLDSHQEMLEVVQIPSGILAEMSSEALLDTCLAYPLFMDMGMHDSLQTGFEQVSAHFNGLSEFLMRPDAGSILVDRYQQMDPSDIDEGWTSLQQGAFSMEFTRIEMLLAQPDILASLAPAERAELGRESLSKLEAKVSRSDVFGLVSKANTVLISGRILEVDDASFRDRVAKKDSLQRFLANAEWADSEPIEETLKCAELAFASAVTAK